MSKALILAPWWTGAGRAFGTRTQQKAGRHSLGPARQQHPLPAAPTSCSTHLHGLLAPQVGHPRYMLCTAPQHSTSPRQLTTRAGLQSCRALPQRERRTKTTSTACSRPRAAARLRCSLRRCPLDMPEMRWFVGAQQRAGHSRPLLASTLQHLQRHHTSFKCNRCQAARARRPVPRR